MEPEAVFLVISANMLFKMCSVSNFLARDYMVKELFNEFG